MLGEIFQQIIDEGGLSDFVQSQPALQSIILNSDSSWKPQMDLLDNDNDGVISAINIDIKKVDSNVLKLITPLLQ